MTLPGSGSISLSQVNTELGRPWNEQIHMGDAAVRNLAQVGGSGAWGMNNLFGKSSLSFSPPPGSYPMQDYAFVSLTITANIPVVWTYGATNASVSVASGGSATSITVTTRVRRNGTTQTSLQTQTNLTATVNGNSYTWSINQYAIADNSSGGI